MPFLPPFPICRILPPSPTSTKSADHPDGRRYLDLPRRAFRDFTRIASSHPAVWTDICLANKNSLLDLIGGLRTQLSELERILSEEDRAALYRYFAAAKQTRDEWLERQ